MNNIPAKACWPGWETVRLIGRGSFGAVYEIERKIFDETEKAALKVISIPQNDSEIDELFCDGYDEASITNTFRDHLKSIVSEYSLMRKMNGAANIVNCDDVRYIQQDNGYGWDIYIKMELLTPLNRALPREIPEETVVKIARDLTSALDLCKRYNIIHRDIKPQNIFVSDNGDYKLGDFGIAKTVEKTSGGTRIGTYKYIAPEVFHNKPYGSAADIYSLGLTLYWMLNERRMPFLPLPPVNLTPSMDELARMRRLSGENLPAPAHGSPELRAIVLKACEADPERRYQTAREMLTDLNRLMRNRELEEYPDWYSSLQVQKPQPQPREEGTALLPEEAAHPEEGTALLSEETALPEEGTALLSEEMTPPDEGTALLEEESGQYAEETALLAEETSLLEEEPARPAHQAAVNTGFSSANEMLEALGLSGLKTQPPERKPQPMPQVSQPVRTPPATRTPERKPQSGASNTGFRSADEMFAALGLNAPKKSVAPEKKRPVPVREEKKPAPVSHNGFSSANEMLEFLGIDSKTMKKK